MVVFFVFVLLKDTHWAAKYIIVTLTTSYPLLRAWI